MKSNEEIRDIIIGGVVQMDNLLQDLNRQLDAKMKEYQMTGSITSKIEVGFVVNKLSHYTAKFNVYVDILNEFFDVDTNEILSEFLKTQRKKYKEEINSLEPTEEMKAFIKQAEQLNKKIIQN